MHRSTDPIRSNHLRNLNRGRRRFGLISAFAATLLLSACGGGSDEAANPNSGAAVTTPAGVANNTSATGGSSPAASGTSSGGTSSSGTSSGGTFTGAITTGATASSSNSSTAGTAAGGSAPGGAGAASSSSNSSGATATTSTGAAGTATTGGTTGGGTSTTTSGATTSGSVTGAVTSSGSSNPPPTPVVDDGSTPNPVGTAAPAMSSESDWPPAFKSLSSSPCSGPLVGSHKTYDVGPGKKHTELTTVPWLSLVAGDVVNIYYRDTPYRTKIGLRGFGSPAAPIYINGVTGKSKDTDCARPEISGEEAVTANDWLKPALKTAKAEVYENPENFASITDQIESLGLISIYRKRSDVKEEFTPQYITIQNLKITHAKQGVYFKDASGKRLQYPQPVAAIYAVRVAHLTVENCEITGNSNGVFTNSRGNSKADFSSYVILRRNEIGGNGNAGSSTEHNTYVQAYRALYEGNFLGFADGGSTLKDRSSGTVVRYNKVLASARALDLVETEESNNYNLLNDPLYNYAWVYGNLIINDVSAKNFAAKPIHWGMDNTEARAKTGTLFFYGNTYVHKSKSSNYDHTSVFEVGGVDDNVPNQNMAVEASGNIFWNNDGSTAWKFLANVRNGRLKLRGVNYVPTNWRDEVDSLILVRTMLPSDTLATAKWNNLIPLEKRIDQNGHTAVKTGVPDTLQINPSTYIPASGSLTSLDRGILGPTFTPIGAKASNLLIEGQFVEPAGIVKRVVRGNALDLGAFEGP